MSTQGDDHGRAIMLDDLRMLAQVGRMYLDAVDSDPELEMMTLPQALAVADIRDAVERWEQS